MLRMISWTSRSARMVALMVVLVAAMSVMSAGAAGAAGVRNGTNAPQGGASGTLRIHIANSLSNQGIPDVALVLVNMSGTMVAKGQTDKEGLFTFNVLASDYTLVSSKAGYIPTKVGTSIFPNETSLMMLTMIPNPVPANSRASQKGVVLGIYVGNTFTNQGIVGANITIMDSTGTAIVKGSTDAQGLYSTNLTPGVYNVVIRAADYYDNKLSVDLTNTTPQATWVSVMMQKAPAPTSK